MSGTIIASRRCREDASTGNLPPSLSGAFLPLLRCAPV